MLVSLSVSLRISLTHMCLLVLKKCAEAFEVLFDVCASAVSLSDSFLREGRVEWRIHIGGLPKI